MDINLRNCNNIDEGNIIIEEGKLNIKYATNGTGKTTISKALINSISFKEDENKIKELRPFKYYGLEEDESSMPQILGVDCIKSIEVFDEEYIRQYTYLPDEIIKNSFEIFIKTKDYDMHMMEINKLVESIKKIFNEDEELSSFINELNEFVNGFGKAKSGFSKTGTIGKGLGKGNKIINIPEGLDDYKDYLQNDLNVSWLKWLLSGKEYVNISNKCPYCTSDIEGKKDKILKVSEHYNAKEIEQLNKIIEVFQKLEIYFTEETNKKIQSITKNISGLSSEHINFLKEIKEEVVVLLNKLINIRTIGFNSLKDVDKVIDELNSYKIDISYLSHLNTIHTDSKIKMINEKLDDILMKAGKLQGEINKQKIEIRKTIDNYNNEINDFLKYAGYKYNVIIEQEEDSYKMKLRHNDLETTISNVKTHLSYGEKNAFALVLFMYNALRTNADLIILDDPISSFDKNKKFAIINKLFRGKKSFQGKTVLMLTHDFDPVIDIIYNLPNKFNPRPKASFLQNSKGVLKEIDITKDDIQTFVEIATTNIVGLSEDINKFVYLRRLYEVENNKGNGWQLLSNLFHKREHPVFKEANGSERDMTENEVEEGIEEIRKYVDEFNYTNEYKQIIDTKKMIELYSYSSNNYEKLQIYRVINNDNSKNDVIRKFVNESFHIENDYLFQLNPCKYEIIPQYIIEECDKDIEEIRRTLS